MSGGRNGVKTHLYNTVKQVEVGKQKIWGILALRGVEPDELKVLLVTSCLANRNILYFMLAKA